MKQPKTSVGIAGLGAIGRKIATEIVESLPAYEISAVASGRKEVAKAFLDNHNIEAEIVEASDLALHSEVIIECAPARFLRDVLEPAIQRSRYIITLSARSLLEN